MAEDKNKNSEPKNESTLEDEKFEVPSITGHIKRGETTVGEPEDNLELEQKVEQEETDLKPLDDESKSEEKKESKKEQPVAKIELPEEEVDELSDSSEEKSITEQSEKNIEKILDKKEGTQEGVEQEKKFKSKEINLDKYLIKFQKVSLRDKIFFTKNLGVMLKAGLSLGKALEALAEQATTAKFKKILTAVEDKVKKGHSFAEALKDHPKTFNELFISMIESGEASGNMEEVLKQLHKQMSRDQELISKVKGAMIYPSIVVTAMVGIGTAMMIFVVPKFVSIFEEVNAELPIITRMLISVSKFITSNGLVVALALIILVTVAVYFFRTERGKKFLHMIFLKLPIMAPISKKINLARFSRTLSSLLNTDIPIVQSFEITAKVLGNFYYKQALREAAEKIKKGEQVNDVLRKHYKLFPAVVVQMITVGEETGSLDSILDEVASFYEDDVDQTMKNLPTIIEPILMLILGAGVGFMAVAIMMPMYSLTQVI